MQALNYVRTYAQTGEHAAYRPVRRPARDARIAHADGKFTLGGVRYPLFFTTFVNAGALSKVDAEMLATIRRIVADGYNGLCLRSATSRHWTESAYNWGVWKYISSDASYANRWEMEEAALVQFDKMVAWSLDEGIECLYVDFEGYEEIAARHPNQRPLGTYRGDGMYWSSEYRQMAWDVNSRLLLRTSSITGTRHIDNPRIIWKFTNETGFMNAYTRSSTASWGGGGAVTYFAKIVDGIADANGDNGYWYTELNAKLTAWRDAYAPEWAIPAWGRGSTGVADGAVGFPKRETWFNWATGADPATDQARLIDFITYIDVEVVNDTLSRMCAENPDVLLNHATFNYMSAQAQLMIPEERRRNVFFENHHYFSDANSTGVKLGSAVTRKSCMDSSWNIATNGSGWSESQGGTRPSWAPFIAAECGQYTANRWRYQRMYYETILAQLHGYDLSDFHQAQQQTVAQYTTDGRYMQGDHANVSSPTARLCARALAVVHRNQFLTEHADSFIIRATTASMAAWNYANKMQNFSAGNRLNAGYASDGTENAVFGAKKVFFEMDDTFTPTTDWSAYPKVSDATMAAGTYLRNTATEKVYVRRNHGMQIMTPYMAGFVDELVEKAAADAIFAMPLYLSSMAAAVTCAVCFLRSDGLWPLFTGPMKLYIHGSDFSDDLVLQGSDYAQHAAGALGANNPPGGAYFMANDEVTVYYSGASSQTWGSGNSSAAATWLMMPEAFTLNLDTTAVGGTDMEIFGITTAGVPVRLPSTYNAGTKVWSFNYTGAYPEYTLQPVAATARATPRGKRR